MADKKKYVGQSRLKEIFQLIREKFISNTIDGDGTTIISTDRIYQETVEIKSSDKIYTYDIPFDYIGAVTVSSTILVHSVKYYITPDLLIEAKQDPEQNEITFTPSGNKLIINHSTSPYYWNGYTDRIIFNRIGGKTLSTSQDINQMATDIENMSSEKADKATTLAGYGITDGATKTELNAKANSATTLAGYGITDGATKSELNSKANSATTLSGYGITDGATKSELNTKADKATTLADYGITDAKISGTTITLGNQSVNVSGGSVKVNGTIDFTSITASTTDIGAGSTLANGQLYVVYE